MEIQRADEDNQTAFWQQYPGQTSPQGVHLEVDFDGETMCVDWDAEIGGGGPFNAWHGRLGRSSPPCGIAAGGGKGR